MPAVWSDAEYENELVKVGDMFCDIIAFNDSTIALCPNADRQLQELLDHIQQTVSRG